MIATQKNLDRYSGPEFLFCEMNVWRLLDAARRRQDAADTSVTVGIRKTRLDFQSCLPDRAWNGHVETRLTREIPRATVAIIG